MIEKRSVTEAALLKRINRKLRKSFEQIKKCRENSKWINELGAYYAVDLQNNAIVEAYINIEALATEEGILKDSEEMLWD